MTYYVRFIGLDMATSKRTWGYIITDEPGDLYIFWGIVSNGSIRFVRSVRDDAFYRNLKNKRRKYENMTQNSTLSDYITGLFSQYRVIKALKGGRNI